MTKYTAAEFRARVQIEPDWASKLKEPVEITEYCDLEGSKISHLSPLLHFTGRNGLGECATFAGNKNLTVAEGNFSGHVSFYKANLTHIGELNIRRNNDRRESASFYGCKNLKIATGKFPGHVSFSHSGVEKIKDLQVSIVDSKEHDIDFSFCPNLRVSPKHGWTKNGLCDMDDSNISHLSPLLRFTQTGTN